ncbi:hypothetical protein SDJN02_21455, partial [Cucurbita argyrosperma subsp. argyrosperma]
MEYKNKLEIGSIFTHFRRIVPNRRRKVKLIEVRLPLYIARLVYNFMLLLQFVSSTTLILLR